MRAYFTPLLAVVTVTVCAVAQDPPPPAAANKKPLEQYRDIRDEISQGRFELAAEGLTAFVALTPTPQDYLDIEGKYGPTTFLSLGNIPRWYDDPTKDAAFKKGTLATVLAASQKANEALTRDPNRIRYYVRRLAGIPEERDYAIAELRRGGDAVVPYLIESLRLDRKAEQEAGIMSAIRTLGPDIVPGIVAAAGGVADELKVPLLRSVAGRSDVTTLVGMADTDFTPLLWYLSSGNSPAAPVARELLNQLTGGASDRRDAAAELVALAAPMTERRARFAAIDSVTKKVKASTWDATAQTVKSDTVSKSDAEEIYGLRILRWAVERKPGYAPAEELFVALAVERAVERANFLDLAKADPAAYKLIAGAPAVTLVNLLEAALAEQRTALAYGLIAGLGDRAQKLAAQPPSKNTAPPLVRALNYPDPRVQFAAAVALLKIPSDATAGVSARIVDILKRSLASDTGDKAAKRAVIVDPSVQRSDQTAGLFRAIGYSTEQIGTGRELLRRVSRAADIDLVVLDRHVADPEFTDVLAQLTSDANFGRRPVLLVASADKPKPVGLETLLVRLALLIAATETEESTLPPVNVIDIRKADEDRKEERRLNAKVRDASLQSLFNSRLARMRRIVAAANVITSATIRDRLELRMPQLTYAALIAEFDPTPTTAPDTFSKLDQLTKRLLADTDLDPAVDGVPTTSLARLTLELEGALTPPLREKFEGMRKRINPDSLGVRREVLRDPLVEADLNRRVRRFAGVSVIAEPYIAKTLDEEVTAVLQDDPTKKPRNPDEKSASAKVAAEWLRKMAVGEVAGYDVRPADAALRKSLGVDDLAPITIDAVGRLRSAEAQQDLVRLALMPNRPLPIRMQAAEAAATHLQANGKLLPPDMAAGLTTAAAQEANAELRSRLALLRQQAFGTAADLGGLIQGYQPGAIAPPKPAAGNPESK